MKNIAIIILISIILTLSTHIKEIKSQTCYTYSAANPGVCTGPGYPSPENIRCDDLSPSPGYACILNAPPPASTGGSGRGQCIATDTCQCYDGWGGFRCQFAECSNVQWQDAAASPYTVCSGRGTCEGPNTCRCWAGNGAGTPTATATGPALYEGDNCEYPVCFGIPSNNPLVCNGRAILQFPLGPPPNQRNGCYAPDTCDCTNLYTGATTQYQDRSWGYGGANCENLYCNNQLSNVACGGPTKGTCQVKSDATTLGGRNRCVCKTGYASAEADINHASNDGDYGICNLFVCNGKRSNNDDGPVCSGHGTCTAPNTCNCVANYGSSDCEKHMCFGKVFDDAQVCSGHGTCGSINTCTCAAGYSGTQCEFRICNGLLDNNPAVCSGHGQCDPDHNTPGQCHCSAGYEGTNCDLYRCYGKLSGDGTVCSSHGSCDAINTCNCAAGYINATCDVYTCFSTSYLDNSVCNNHGVCEGLDDCKCVTGYYHQINSDDCKYPLCFGTPSTVGTVCNSKGTCVGIDDCDCNTGYAGERCELKTCFSKYSNDPQVCSGHGVCGTPEVCSCNTGWGGNQCQTPICHGRLANDPDVCSGFGTCDAPDACTCTANGRYGDNCELKYCVSRATTCNGHGDCFDTNPLCQCDSGWQHPSTNCSEAICYSIGALESNVCNGHGSCVSNDTCSCTNYEYSGPQCDKPGCFGLENDDPMICSGNGTCVGVDTCDCRTDIGYMNSRCTNPICYGKSVQGEVCSGHGECVGFNNCTCETGWFGNECEQPLCNNIAHDNPTVCNGQGTCTSKDTCVCGTAFTGQFCQYPTCFGVNGDDPFVCAGHGTCVEPNTCECDNSTSYSGFNCEKPGCFGYKATDPEVCFGRGTCIKEDQCICAVGSGVGSNCEINVCNGINSTNSNVCSGRGNCTAPDVCDCHTNYGNTFCQDIMCFGKIESNTSYVCHGHGNCINIDVCQCNLGFMGEECQHVSCGGVQQEILCNNHGTCTNSTACVCETGYFGKFCSKKYEQCPNSKAVGTVNHPCDSCLGTDSGKTQCESYLSESWTYIVDEVEGKSQIKGLYKVPDRPVNGELTIDCAKVLSPASLDLIGNFPTCSWDSANSDSFTITFGSQAKADSNTVFNFNMLPYEDDVEMYSEVNTEEPTVISPPVEEQPPPYWIIGVAVPGGLIVIFGILIVLIGICIFCCLCCPCCYKNDNNRIHEYYADQDSRLKAQIREIEENRDAQNLEEQREWRKMKQKLEVEEAQRAREAEELRRQRQLAEQEKLNLEELRAEQARYTPTAKKYTYEWDDTSNRYIEKEVDTSSTPLPGTPFDNIEPSSTTQPGKSPPDTPVHHVTSPLSSPSNQERATNVVNAFQNRFNQSSSSSQPMGRQEDESVPYDFLLAFENQVIANTLSQRAENARSRAQIQTLATPTSQQPPFE